MTKLKKLIGPALGAMLVMGIAAPAQANYYHDPRDIRAELRQFEQRIDRAAYNGRLSERNATWLSYRLRGARQQFRRFRHRGFNDWEISTLNDTLDILQYEFSRRADRGGHRGWRGNRGYRGDYGGRGYRGTRYRDNDRYDDRRGWRGRYRDRD